MTIARKTPAFILSVLIWSAMLTPLPVSADQPTVTPDPPAAALTLREAIGLLAEERNFAEAGAGLLKKYAAEDQSALIRGQRLYAEAKAASDRVIEQLLVDIVENRDPEKSATFAAAIEAAVEKRLSFSRHVETVLPDLEGARNILLEALAKPVGDLIKALIEGSVAVWKEFRRADEARRQAIATRLEAQRWRAFVDVEAAI